MSNDEAVRATNDDAASCKRSAVQLGYWSDPYMTYFIKNIGGRKAPEINRGYYARVTAIRQLLNKFLSLTSRQCQVVNLGAGYDTQFWLTQDSGQAPRVWVDVDFDAVTSAKVYHIRSRRQLNEKLKSPEYTRTCLHCPESGYHLIGCDLRQTDKFMTHLEECGLDKSVPTVFISECVLVYMQASESASLLKCITDHFNTTFFICYEQVNMGDRFGEVMKENLQQRGCGLAGVQHCLSLDTQKNRFLSTGWSSADSMHMMDIYKTLPQHDIQRIERLEMLDDYEMMTQLFEHYCVTWATKDQSKLDLQSIKITNH